MLWDTYGRHALPGGPRGGRGGMTRPRDRARWPAIVAVALTVGAMGCSPSTTPAPSPSGGIPAPSAAGSIASPGSGDSASPAPSRSLVAGLDWRAATDVARPEDAFPSGTPAPTVPSGPGTAGHPGHFPGQATITDVVVHDGRLIAVGYVGPEWRPVAWTSTDADHWSLVEIGRPDPGAFGFAESVSAIPDGGVVAVGRSGSRPVAWTSADGAAWTLRDVPTLGGPADTERMTVVAAGPGGLLAGGSVGPELFERRARLWSSEDGTTWEPVADDPAFDGAEVAALIPVADGWLALGRIGTGQRTTGSVAWRSPDGRRWTRIDDPDLAKGWVRAVTRAPDGSLVAVGSEPDEAGAYAWRSTDEGRTWSLAPGEPSRTYHGKMRMTDVVPTADGLLAVGNFVGVQFGDGASWLSDDAVHWERSPLQPSMGQVEPSAVVAFGDREVMVGTFGAPDNYIPRAWISPPGLAPPG